MLPQVVRQTEAFANSVDPDETAHNEHSDFESADGHWALHRGIQISNVQICDEHFTAAFRFRKLRCALCIPPEHSDLESIDGHWAFHRNIKI